MPLDSPKVPDSAPWTRRFAFSWPQTVNFFEHRYEVLRELEDRGLLRQLRIAEDRIALRLGDANHELVYGLRSVEGSLFQPDGDWTRIADALELVFGALKPKRLLRPELKFQWLVALNQEYDEARSSGAIRLFGEAGESLTDWSGLIDGKIDDPPGTFQAEFGILDRSETPARLARSMGRMGRVDRDSAPPTLWPTSTLPEVAWFFDARCTMKEAPEPTVDGVSTFLAMSETALRQLMSGIMDASVEGEMDNE